MTGTYTKAAKKANAAALFYAERGYQVTTSFGSDCGSIQVVVYFYNCDDRNLIESFMTLYEDENDEITFDKFTTAGLRKFYTLTLIKHIS